MRVFKFLQERSRTRLATYGLLAVFCIAGGAALVYQSVLDTSAGPEDSISGFAWSENIGWISHNNTDTASVVDYGVNIEPDGNMIGYAWSENVGWIDYNAPGPYPAIPQESARFDPCTRTLSGWAKILSLGDDGWTRLAGSSPDHGVTINESNEFDGYAWNDVIGWVDYNPEFGGVVATETSTNQPPETPQLIKPVGNLETWFDYPEFRSSPLTPALSWTDFNDPNCGSSQDSYQIQISEEPTFLSFLHDDVVQAASSAYTIPTGVLTYNNPYKKYYWRVRVRDQGGLWSGWATLGQGGEENSFRTPLHPAPNVQFEMNPPDPNALVEIQFIDKTQVFGSAGISNWRWDLGDGTIVDGNNSLEHGNPTHTYLEKGQYQISLTVTDSDGYSTTLTFGALDVDLPLPEWQRTIPR